MEIWFRGSETDFRDRRRNDRGSNVRPCDPGSERFPANRGSGSNFLAREIESTKLWGKCRDERRKRRKNVSSSSSSSSSRHLRSSLAAPDSIRRRPRATPIRTASSSVFDASPSTGFVLIVFSTLTLLQLASASLSHSYRDFRFVSQPRDVVAIKGRAAILNCDVAGNPKPRVEWKKDNQFLTLKEEQRREILANGSLLIRNIIHTRTERPDEGTYQCVATLNSLGSIVSRLATLKIATLPHFSREPEDLVVSLGGTAFFQCEINAHPTATISWFKDGRPLNLQSPRMRVHPSGGLEIDQAELADKGRYRCRAENAVADRSSAEAELDVVFKPQFTSPSWIVSPSDRTVQVGQSVTIDCVPSGFPKPSVDWLKDSATIDVSNGDSTFTIFGASSLTIRDVKERDAGTYVCRATNSLDSIDAHFTLTVYSPPTFERVCENGASCDASQVTTSGSGATVLNCPGCHLMAPQNSFAYQKGEIEFECSVQGNPEPKVEWMKNGDRIIQSEYFQIVDGHNLRILGLVSSDAGVYQCVASNAVDNIQQSAQLVVLKQDHYYRPQNDQSFPPINDDPSSSSSASFSIPASSSSSSSRTSGLQRIVEGCLSQPHTLTAIIVSTNFATLTWARPQRDCDQDVEGYAVYWRDEKSDRERVVNVTSGSRLEEVNIQGLLPNTKYLFRVVAFNNRGAGESSPSLLVQTQPEVHVPGAAVSLQAHALGKESILVTWRQPNSLNGRIKSYKIWMKKLGSTDEEKEVEVLPPPFSRPIDRLQHRFDHLDNFAEYSFRVVAHNQNGPGPSTENVVARTHSSMPTAPPQNVTLETVSSSVVICRWDPPPKIHRNGVITGYKIRYKRDGARRGSTIVTDGNRRLFSLENLERGTRYAVRLQAMTVNGTGPASEWKEAETFINDLDESRVPGKPDKMLVRPKESSIHVFWSAPKEEDILIRGYMIGYGIGIPDVYNQDLDARQRFVTLENLETSSHYVISLRAYNNKGHGEPIYKSVATLSAATPQPSKPLFPPVGLKPIVISATTIVLTWTDTSLPRNQRITDNRIYTIKCTSLYPANTKSKYINSTDLNRYIDHLKPNTQYEFSVRVIQGRRSSTWSLTASNTTFEAAPWGAPKDLTVVGVEGQPDALMLSWQPPKNPNGRITGYMVYYTTDQNLPPLKWALESVMGTSLTVTIENLTPDTVYYFKIRARNAQGHGPLSPTEIFQTPRVDGTGGGKIKTPEYNWAKGRWETRHDVRKATDPRLGESKPNPFFENSLHLIILGGVAALCLVAIICIVAFFCSRNRNGNQNENKSSAKPTPAPGAKGQPPDLWIHTDGLEMKGIDSSGSSGGSSGVHTGPHPKGTVIGGVGGVVGGVGVNHPGNVVHCGGSSAGDSGQSSGGSGSVSPTPRGHLNPHEMMDPLVVETHHGLGSPGLGSTGKHDSGYITRTTTMSTTTMMSTNERRRSMIPSFYSVEGEEVESELERQILQRRTLRPHKPVVFAVDPMTHTLPREPMAASLHNGHAMEPVNQRHAYPRSQYNTVTPTSSVAGSSRGADSPVGQPYNTPPIPYDQIHTHSSPVIYSPSSTPTESDMSSEGGRSCGSGVPPVIPYPMPPQAPTTPLVKSTSLHRPQGHPLKSFSVPGPPPTSPSVPNAKHVAAMKPQPQVNSPYKKTGPNSAFNKARPLGTLTSPKTPTNQNFSTVDCRNGDIDIPESCPFSSIKKSVSTEELSQEMANLEGLMKDLSAITQSDVEA